jgi:hypothetical protein
VPNASADTVLIEQLCETLAVTGMKVFAVFCPSAKADAASIAIPSQKQMAFCFDIRFLLHEGQTPLSMLLIADSVR